MKKKSDREYVNCKQLLSHTEARFKLLYGGRDNGKSYTVKEFCLKNAIENNNFFAYVRRDELETKPAKVERYFRDYEIYTLTDGLADKVTVFNQTIYLTKVGEDLKEKRIKEIGSVFWLGGAEHYKSLQFPEITDLIFEEFLTDKGYDVNEADNLQSIVSTVFRSREGRIWLIGNTDSKLNPIIQEWGITKEFSKQKRGSVIVYDIGNGQKLASHRVDEVTDSKLTFRRKDVVEDGEWKVDTFSKMRYNIDEYSIIFTIKYESIFNFNIKVCVYLKTGKPFLYVYPNTLEHSKFDFLLNVDRLPYEDFNVWNNLITGELQKKIYALIKEKNIVFSSDSCGTDFIQCLKINKLI